MIYPLVTDLADQDIPVAPDLPGARVQQAGVLQVARHPTQAGILPIRLHDLRHSMATFALGQGVDLKTIQTMLRHSRLSTTADLYTHVLHEVQRSGADRIGDLLTQHGLGRTAANDA